MKKLNKAAAYFFIRRYLSKGVKAFKINTKRSLKAKIITEKRNFIILSSHMKPWKEQTKGIMRAKDFR